MGKTTYILIAVGLVVLYMAMQAGKQVKAAVNSVTSAGQGTIGQITSGLTNSLLGWLSNRGSSGGAAVTTPGTIGTSPYGTPLYGQNYGAWGTSGAMIDPTAVQNPDSLLTPNFSQW